MRKALSVLCALLLLALPLGSLAECAHIWRDGAVLTEGTCVTQGERQIVCTKCGAQSTRTYYGPHCYTTWWDITPATCTSKGLRHYVCRNCDYEKTQETSMLPHNYGAWTTLVPASMYSLGLRGHTCQDCGAYEEDSRAFWLLKTDGRVVLRPIYRKAVTDASRCFFCAVFALFKPRGAGALGRVDRRLPGGSGCGHSRRSRAAGLPLPAC